MLLVDVVCGIKCRGYRQEDLVVQDCIPGRFDRTEKKPKNKQREKLTTT